jgi:2-polyprenyl-3-methyl-5-hydroxy-6-metoxy-1,4-benzoquinol methylase
VADYYRDLAGEYDWLYDDDALTDGFAITRPAVAGLLQRFGPGCAVLDAACGTGVDAAALARRGFHVRAADGSEAMVEVAAARFRREGLAIPVQQCLWADLADTINERFDSATVRALLITARRAAVLTRVPCVCRGGRRNTDQDVTRLS